jgi:predicted Zn-dependent protease
MIKSMLVVLEHTLTTLDKASAAATQLIAAQLSEKPLSVPTLRHYEREFQNLTENRERMRDIIGKWWTLVEDKRPH